MIDGKSDIESGEVFVELFLITRGDERDYRRAAPDQPCEYDLIYRPSGFRRRFPQRGQSRIEVGTVILGGKSPIVPDVGAPVKR